MPRSPKEALQPEAAPLPPHPPRRRRPRFSAFSGLLSFLLLAAIGSMAGIVWGEHRMREPGPLPANKVVYIAPGTEVAEIIADLDREGVIDSPLLLNVALLVEGNRSKVKAGEYLFKEKVSLQEVIDTLVSGKQVLHAITIPEGLTSEQIVERLRESEILVGEIADVPREGSLLPETYKVTRGTARSDLVKKMQDGQKRLVDQIWAHRANGLPLRSPYELVTLASIVEKETGKPDERPRVASVFLNRLKKRMRLQSDPTIIYGLTQGKGPLGAPITRADIEKPTAYNTYLIDGLPPGPIANPGRASLEAVANPSHTQDLYFVADGSGGHAFAETLDQHNRNVQRLRQVEQQPKDKAEPPVTDAVKPSPQAAPVPPTVQPVGEQKSQLEAPSVYGTLAVPPNAASAAAAPAAAAIAGAAPAAPSPHAQDQARKAGASVSAYTFGPGLDHLGISVGRPRAAASVLDGPVGEDDAGTDGPSPGVEGGLKSVRARAFDASEGTPLDPLQNQTYDLNYAKTVPVLQ